MESGRGHHCQNKEVSDAENILKKRRGRASERAREGGRKSEREREKDGETRKSEKRLREIERYFD